MSVEDSHALREEGTRDSLNDLVRNTLTGLGRGLERAASGPSLEEYGIVTSVGRGIAYVRGLPGVGVEELIRFPDGEIGMVFDLMPEQVGIILLDNTGAIRAGSEVHRTGRILDVPVGRRLLGRVVDALGRPRDGHGPLPVAERRPLERDAPAIMDRAPVSVPLETGLKVVDALIPIGRGQRQLIVGDRQTGKTSVAVDAIMNQRGKNVRCVYCAVGQRSSAIARVAALLAESQAMDYTVVVASTGDDVPGLQFIAPFAAMTIGEYFMERGEDVLVVLDDLTRHAVAYRELSLLLRRPPGREGFPGDVFYLHSRLLERSTHLSRDLGGGSLTALPVVETEEENIAAYIPTNLISITDGQIYLSPGLFQKGVLPAVDVGRSVSRVGGKTQLPSYRAAAGSLRLSYAQFEELEAFSRFGARLDEDTRRTIERGRRVREVLKQPEASPVPVPVQIAIILALNAGLFDALSLDAIAEGMHRIRLAFEAELADIEDRILAGDLLDDAAADRVRRVAADAVRPLE